MSWVKIDDQVGDHPKFATIDPAAGWMWVCGNAYCSKHLTDGFIPDYMVTRLVSVPPSRARHLAGLLIERKLWEPVEGGVHVHDYLDYNRPAQKVLAERAASRKRKEAWLERRSEQRSERRGERDLEHRSERSEDAVRNAVGNSVGTLPPTRPDLLPPYIPPQGGTRSAHPEKLRQFRGVELDHLGHVKMLNGRLMLNYDCPDSETGPWGMGGGCVKTDWLPYLPDARQCPFHEQERQQQAEAQP